MAIINTLLTNGINLDPIDAVGGLQQLWICASFSQTAITLGVTASRIDSLTGSGTFFQFDIPKDTSSFTETATIAPASGTLFYQGDLLMVFHKLEQYRRNQLNLLARNRFIRAVFQDNNNRWWIVGLTRGAQVSAGTNQTGVAPGDMSGYSYTIQSQEPNPAFFMNGTASMSGFTWTAATVVTT
jgi:hypothetical protein